MSDGLWSKDSVCIIPGMKEQAIVFHIRKWMEAYIVKNSILAEHEKPEDYIRIRAIEDGTLVRGELSVRLPAEEREAYPYGEHYPFVHPWFRALVHPTVEGGVCVEIAYTDGDVLLPMAEALLLEMLRLSPQAVLQSARPEQPKDIPEWVPKTDTAFDRWRRTYYQVFNQYRKELYDAADLDEKPFSPELKDYREYLRRPDNLRRTGWRSAPDLKWIGRILKAGDNGWLSKKSR